MHKNADHPNIIREYEDAQRPTAIELHQRRNVLIQVFKLASIGLTVLGMVLSGLDKKIED